MATYRQIPVNTVVNRIAHKSWNAQDPNAGATRPLGADRGVGVVQTLCLFRPGVLLSRSEPGESDRAE